MLSRLEVAVAVVFGVSGVACTRASAGSSSSASGVGTSTGMASGSSSGGTGQGSGTGSGTTSGTGGGSNAAGTAGTTGTASSSGGSPFVDGGYVYCSLPNAADAGPNGDGGLARWMCRPGTYFCDLSGDLGNCFACRSDADCADQSLPTYDPLKPHCDLDSGIAGYQNFCQQCLRNADCAGNAAGTFCDSNPTFPPNALEAPIEDLGFETCGRIQTDCRQEGGPLCGVSNQVCNPFTGQCETRSTSCSTDQDCVGLLIPTSVDPETGSPYLLRPYCVNGACNACDGGVCPGGCTSSSQCSGFWPVCTGLDGGNVDGAGDPIGVCSCTSDADCGDGGLACLPPAELNPSYLPTIFGAQAGANFCGVPCTSPDFPSCAALAGVDICDLTARVCNLCVTDEQCVSSVGSGGPFCDYYLPTVPTGYCGCTLDADCPAGDSCLSEGSHSTALGICTPSFSRCTPETCGEGWFCDWDSGACVNLADILSFPSCVSDADCSGSRSICVEGTCVGCRDNADCLHGGPTQATLCCAQGRTDTQCRGYVLGSCVGGCATDQDCVGNVQGPSCLSLPSGGKACGCGTDADCTQNPGGPHCDTNPRDNGLFGQCTCLAAVECAAGWSCERTGSAGAGTCVPYCDNGKCPSGFACDSSGTCRPECVDSRDCDGGLGCRDKVCEPCSGAADCVAGTVCLADGLCHASCDAGICPTGERCDSLDEAGGGSNVCYQCVSAADCPDDEGCDSQSHSCGTCRGPTAASGPFDCPPDAVCSNYWLGTVGVCLPNCDRESCPADRPICAALPSLTPDHKYCFGCLRDVDCGDAGAWCDQSVNRTFTCQGP